MRDQTIAYLFGATGLVSMLRVALIVPTMIYDLLVGGFISAALVPVFSDYIDKTRRTDLWRIASVMISLTLVALALVVITLEVFTSQLVWALGSGYDDKLQEAAVGLVRVILPATIFLGVSGIATAVLYSLKRFRYPAFTAALFNLSIVVCALLLSRWFGIASVVVGVLIGAIGQLALQVLGLRDFRFRFSFDWNHPALRKILRLYAPVVAGLAISNLQIGLDRNLASHTVAQAVAWMQNATTLIQFPLGLVVTAISFAILPTLSRQSLVASLQSTDGTPNIRPPDYPTIDFHSTLAFGIKLVLLLIVPATVGLFILAHPIVALLFEHGAFLSSDTTQTALALQFYLIGLPFAAIDQPLVFAFYARKNTLLPNLVQLAAVGVYLIVALALIQSYGMIGLVIANSALWMSHALMMLWFTRTRLGGFGRTRISAMVLKIIAASAAMGVLAYFVLGGVAFIAINAVSVIVPGIVAIIAYAVLLKILRVREAEQMWQLIASRLTLRRPMV